MISKWFGTIAAVLGMLAILAQNETEAIVSITAALVGLIYIVLNMDHILRKKGWWVLPQPLPAPCVRRWLR